jgi:hypothetical protein
MTSESVSTRGIGLRVLESCRRLDNIEVDGAKTVTFKHPV